MKWLMFMIFTVFLVSLWSSFGFGALLHQSEPEDYTSGKGVYHITSGLQATMWRKMFSFQLNLKSSGIPPNLIIRSLTNAVGKFPIVTRNQLFVPLGCQENQHFSINGSGIYFGTNELLTGKLYSTGSKAVKTTNPLFAQVLGSEGIKKMNLIEGGITRSKKMMLCIVAGGPILTKIVSNVSSVCYVQIGDTTTDRIRLISASQTCSSLFSLRIPCKVIPQPIKIKEGCPVHTTRLREESFKKYTSQTIVVKPSLNKTLNVSEDAVNRTRRETYNRPFDYQKEYLEEEWHVPDYMFFEPTDMPSFENNYNENYKENEGFANYFFSSIRDYISVLVQPMPEVVKKLGRFIRSMCGSFLGNSLQMVFTGHDACEGDYATADDLNKLKTETTSMFKETQKGISSLEKKTDFLHTQSVLLRNRTDSNHKLILLGVAAQKVEKLYVQRLKQQTVLAFAQALKQRRQLAARITLVANELSNSINDVEASLQLFKLKQELDGLGNTMFLMITPYLQTLIDDPAVSETFGVWSVVKGAVYYNVFSVHMERIGPKVGVSIPCASQAKCIGTTLVEALGLCFWDFRTKLAYYSDSGIELDDKITIAQSSEAPTHTTTSNCPDILRVGNKYMSFTGIKSGADNINKYTLFTPRCKSLLHVELGGTCDKTKVQSQVFTWPDTALHKSLSVPSDNYPVYARNRLTFSGVKLDMNGLDDKLVKVFKNLTNYEKRSNSLFKKTGKRLDKTDVAIAYESKVEKKVILDMGAGIDDLNSWKAESHSKGATTGLIVWCVILTIFTGLNTAWIIIFICKNANSTMLCDGSIDLRCGDFPVVLMMIVVVLMVVKHCIFLFRLSRANKLYELAQKFGDGVVTATLAGAVATVVRELRSNVPVTNGALDVELQKPTSGTEAKVAGDDSECADLCSLHHGLMYGFSLFVAINQLFTWAILMGNSRGNELSRPERILERSVRQIISITKSTGVPGVLGKLASLSLGESADVIDSFILAIPFVSSSCLFTNSVQFLVLLISTNYYLPPFACLAACSLHVLSSLYRMGYLKMTFREVVKNTVGILPIIAVIVCFCSAFDLKQTEALSTSPPRNFSTSSLRNTSRTTQLPTSNPLGSLTPSSTLGMKVSNNDYIGIRLTTPIVPEIHCRRFAAYISAKGILGVPDSQEKYCHCWANPIELRKLNVTEMYIIKFDQRGVSLKKVSVLSFSGRRAYSALNRVIWVNETYNKLAAHNRTWLLNVGSKWLVKKRQYDPPSYVCGRNHLVHTVISHPNLTDTSCIFDNVTFNLIALCSSLNASERQKVEEEDGLDGYEVLNSNKGRESKGQEPPQPTSSGSSVHRSFFLLSLVSYFLESLSSTYKYVGKIGLQPFLNRTEWPGLQMPNDSLTEAASTFQTGYWSSSRFPLADPLIRSCIRSLATTGIGSVLPINIVEWTWSSNEADLMAVCGGLTAPLKNNNFLSRLTTRLIVELKITSYMHDGTYDYVKVPYGTEEQYIDDRPFCQTRTAWFFIFTSFNAKHSDRYGWPRTPPFSEEKRVSYINPYFRYLGTGIEDRVFSDYKLGLICPNLRTAKDNFYSCSGFEGISKRKSYWSVHVPHIDENWSISTAPTDSPTTNATTTEEVRTVGTVPSGLRRSRRDVSSEHLSDGLFEYGVGPQLSMSKQLEYSTCSDNMFASLSCIPKVGNKTNVVKVKVRPETARKKRTLTEAVTWSMINGIIVSDSGSRCADVRSLSLKGFPILLASVIMDRHDVLEFGKARDVDMSSTFAIFYSDPKTPVTSSTAASHYIGELSYHYAIWKVKDCVGLLPIRCLTYIKLLHIVPKVSVHKSCNQLGVSVLVDVEVKRNWEGGRFGRSLLGLTLKTTPKAKSKTVKKTKGDLDLKANKVKKDNGDKVLVKKEKSASKPARASTSFLKHFRDEAHSYLAAIVFSSYITPLIFGILFFLFWRKVMTRLRSLKNNLSSTTKGLSCINKLGTDESTLSADRVILKSEIMCRLATDQQTKKIVVAFAHTDKTHTFSNVYYTFGPEGLLLEICGQHRGLKSGVKRSNKKCSNRVFQLLTPEDIRGVSSIIEVKVLRDEIFLLTAQYAEKLQCASMMFAGSTKTWARGAGSNLSGPIVALPPIANVAFNTNYVRPASASAYQREDIGAAVGGSMRGPDMLASTSALVRNPAFVDAPAVG